MRHRSRLLQVYTQNDVPAAALPRWPKNGSRQNLSVACQLKRLCANASTLAGHNDGISVAPVESAKITRLLVRLRQKLQLKRLVIDANGMRQDTTGCAVAAAATRQHTSHCEAARPGVGRYTGIGPVRLLSPSAQRAPCGKCSIQPATTAETLAVELVEDCLKRVFAIVETFQQSRLPLGVGLVSAPRDQTDVVVRCHGQVALQVLCRQPKSAQLHTIPGTGEHVHVHVNGHMCHVRIGTHSASLDFPG